VCLQWPGWQGLVVRAGLLLWHGAHRAIPGYTVAASLQSLS